MSGLAWMKQSPISNDLVVHCNHPNEIDDAFLSYIKKIARCSDGIKSVRVINKISIDCADALTLLSKNYLQRVCYRIICHFINKVNGCGILMYQKKSATNNYFAE